MLNVDRGVTFAGGNRASPFCSVAKRRRYFAERALGADLDLATGTSAEFTTGAPCLGARIRGWRKQGRAAGMLREGAPRVSCAGNLREHYANMAAPCRMRRTPRDKSEKVWPRRPLFFGRGLLLSARADAYAVSPFLGAVFFLPPAAFSSFPAVFSFLPGRPRPRFSSFWPRNVGRGFFFRVRSSRGVVAA